MAFTSAASGAVLLDLLKEIDLLEIDQLERLRTKPAVLDQPAEELAATLIEDGLLTKYQTDQVLSGLGHRLVLGPYRLMQPIGGGGMGQVYKAFQVRLNRPVAVKVIAPHLQAADPQVVRRFQREAQAVARLQHPNIVVIYDSDRAGDTYYIAMEYVEGTDLARRVKQSGPLPVPDALEFVRQAALGLQHAHEAGLVHRDIKPHNLLLTTATPAGARSGTFRRPGSMNFTTPPSVGVVKILDLGLVRCDHTDAEVSYTPLTNLNAVMGTPDYIAPEQARDPRAVDTRADIYSLGCTLYFLLTGRPPFPGGGTVEKLLAHQLDEPMSIETIRPEVGPAVLALARKMMAKRPEDRYQQPQDVADAIENLLAGPAPAHGHALTHAVPDVLANADTGCDLVAASNSTLTNKDSNGMIRTRARKRAVLQGHQACLSALGFSPDGQLLATGALDETVRVWDVGASRPTELASWRGTQLTAVNVFAYLPGGTGLLVGSATLDGRIWRWYWDEPNHRGQLVQVDANSVDSIALQAGGDLVAAANGKAVWVWRTGGDQFKRRSLLKSPRATVKAVALPPDGKTIAAGCEDGVLTVWEFGRFWDTQKHAWTGHEGAVTALTYSPDGLLLATGGLDHVVHLWDVRGEQPHAKATLSWCDGVIRQLAFLDAGRQLLAISDRGQVLLWDAASGGKVREWQLEPKLISRLAVSSTGLLAAGGSDGRVTLYDLDLPSFVPTACSPSKSALVA
jgi:serine/threonine protein kinase